MVGHIQLTLIISGPERLVYFGAAWTAMDEVLLAGKATKRIIIEKP